MPTRFERMDSLTPFYGLAAFLPGEVPVERMIERLNHGYGFEVRGEDSEAVLNELTNRRCVTLRADKAEELRRRATDPPCQYLHKGIWTMILIRRPLHHRTARCHVFVLKIG